MADRIAFTHYKGVEILEIDWSNAQAEEILDAIETAKRMIVTRPLQSVRTLTSVAGSRLDRRVTNVLKAYVEHNKPYVLAGAVVGLNDLKTVVFNFVNRATGRSLRAMDTTAAAREWLAGVSGKEPER